MPSGIFCILILAFSGFVSGVSGFGFSMVALTLLSLLFEIKSAVVFLAAHTLACNIIQIIKLRKKTLAGFLAGAAGGALMGGLLSGGPPVIIYSLKSVGNKHQIKAILQSFFLFSSAYAVILYFASDLLTVRLLVSSMLYLPATIIGTGLGIWVFEAISFAAFWKIMLVFMTLLGLSLLLTTAPG